MAVSFYPILLTSKPFGVGSYEITMDEIMKSLKRMKVGKAVRYDRVSSEMLRDGGSGKLADQFLDKCWESHRVPNDWCKAVIVPLYKRKGSLQVCTNYRSISLLSVVGKLYAKILIENVVNETESKIWDVQAGFRKGWDQIFSLRNIVFS
ncbi:hypothetical protein EVAR_69657_1 [Eumeta japonica]|uniref:Reverse transcriptase domain-containing protein n=1 Tax=Eumeta variegata TaxID=151549 RepID=A0A4C2A4E8_EUMVA|nr:hypothetical protein EVAR_69657_1 [Eumeta japonica]